MFSLTMSMMPRAAPINPIFSASAIVSSSFASGSGFGQTIQPARHEAAGDLHHLAIAFGNHQTHAGAFALQQRIGGNCGAVKEDLHIRRHNLRFGADGFHTVQDAFRAVMRR